VQNILRRNGLFADAALGECQISGIDGSSGGGHRHVEVLVDRVLGERPRRVGG
jgi:hypothetical protein